MEKGPHIRVSVVMWPEAKAHGAAAVRHTVFVEEQQVPASLETDEQRDSTCFHALAVEEESGRVVGTGRLLPEESRIGRMAVLQSHRSLGIGGLLLEALIDKARSLGHRRVTVSAQLPAEQLYARNGFVRIGNEYEVPGVSHRHVDMRKLLASVYLDHNSTTPLCSAAVEAMQKGLTELWGNPGSAGCAGDAARAAIAECKRQVAALLSCDAAHLVVTSGGTEANNTALRSVLEGTAGRCVTSAFEHPAVDEVLKALPEVQVVRVPVDRRGQIDEAAFVAELQKGAALVSVMWANNEVGSINDIPRLCRLTREHCPGAVFHTDAAQAIGKTRVEVGDVDMLTLVAHKLYGPKLIGVLYSRLPLRPLLLGGSQQEGRRAGTESALLCAGLGAAAQSAREGLARNAFNILEMRNLLWSELQKRFPAATKWNESDERLSLGNTLSVCLDPKSALLANQVVNECATKQVYFSAGAACHRGAVHPSQTLVAIGVPPQAALRTLRLSTGAGTTAAEVEDAVLVICSVMKVPF